MSMAPKKSKGKGITSNSNRDQDELQYDQNRFISLSASNKFTSTMAAKTIIPGWGLRLKVDFFLHTSSKKLLRLTT